MFESPNTARCSIGRTFAKDYGWDLLGTTKPCRYTIKTANH